MVNFPSTLSSHQHHHHHQRIVFPRFNSSGGDPETHDQSVGGSHRLMCNDYYPFSQPRRSCSDSLPSFKTFLFVSNNLLTDDFHPHPIKVVLTEVDHDWRHTSTQNTMQVNQVCDVDDDYGGKYNLWSMLRRNVIDRAMRLPEESMRQLF